MKVHFIGIGGIGVSALAKYYLEKGCQITGSDLVSSEITDALKKRGVQIYIGKHRAENLSKNVDMVIYSPAVSKDNPELKKARKLKIGNWKLEIKSYPEALGKLTKQHFTIAVSGTHGKSTTTAMLSLILTKGGLNPTVILGTKLKEFGNSNFRMGSFPKSKTLNLKSKILVIEADEHFASFLNYWPRIIVLTRIEADHLDYFKNFKNYITAFKKFISHLPKDGILVVNRDDINISNLKSQISKLQLKTKNYSLKQVEAKKIKKLLKIPGEHNISNALAALAVARVLKIPDKISFKALSEYKGSWRRFEETTGFLIRPIVRIRKPRTKLIKFKVISDYAHHPTEIKVTLKAAREKYPKKPIWLIYQPHQYQRTYYLFKDFVKVFREAPVDKLIITDIYDVVGREEKEIKKQISSKKLVEAINQSFQLPVLENKNVVYLSNFEKIKNYLKKNLKGGEVVIIMGAGDIYNLSLHLTEKERKEKI